MHGIQDVFPYVALEAWPLRGEEGRAEGGDRGHADQQPDFPFQGFGASENHPNSTNESTEPVRNDLYGPNKASLRGQHIYSIHTTSYYILLL